MSESGPFDPSPLAGEGGARAEGVGGRGGASRQATQKSLAELLDRKRWLLERARDMRSNPTEAEIRLWAILRAKRFSETKWKRQQIIDDRYIVDFICFAHRLIVEADGSQHSESPEDIERDAYLTTQGFRVLRFWNNDILARTDTVAETIWGALDFHGGQTSADPSPQPLPRKGGGALDGAHHA